MDSVELGAVYRSSSRTDGVEPLAVAPDGPNSCPDEDGIRRVVAVTNSQIEREFNHGQFRREIVSTIALR